MAKTRAANDVALFYPATTAYKQWLRASLELRGWTMQRLVDEMKRVAKAELLKIPDTKGRTKYDTISTATISDFLGPEEERPVPSSSKLLPAFNKTLGIAPPPVCEPTDELDQLVDRFRARWAKMTPRDRRLLLEILSNENE